MLGLCPKWQISVWLHRLCTVEVNFDPNLKTDYVKNCLLITQSHDLYFLKETVSTNSYRSMSSDRISTKK